VTRAAEHLLCKLEALSSNEGRREGGRKEGKKKYNMNRWAFEKLLSGP
jgi:hypothetical protein